MKNSTKEKSMTLRDCFFLDKVNTPPSSSTPILLFKKNNGFIEACDHTNMAYTDHITLVVFLYTVQLLNTYCSKHKD